MPTKRRTHVRARAMRRRRRGRVAASFHGARKRSPASDGFPRCHSLHGTDAEPSGRCSKLLDDKNTVIYEGIDAIAPLLAQALGANRMPATASYLRPWGEQEFRAFKIDVLRIEQELIAEITTFGAGMFEAFGLPPILTEEFPPG